MEKKILVIVSVLGGLVFGVFFTGLVFSFSAEKMMLMEIKSPYEFEKTVEVITNRINSNGDWKVTNIVDQNKAVVDGGAPSIGKFVIIKYCSPKYSSEMLQGDDRKKIGVMMPKSFAVYEKTNGQVYISTANGGIMSKIFDSEADAVLEKVSLEVEGIMSFVNLKFNVF
jgi:uncharacterized protein (DUF302 family)